MRRTVVGVVQHGKDLALAGEPSGFTVRQSLPRLGKAKTELSQPLDVRSVLGGNQPNGMGKRLLRRRRRARNGLLLGARYWSGLLDGQRIARSSSSVTSSEVAGRDERRKAEVPN